MAGIDGLPRWVDGPPYPSGKSGQIHPAFGYRQSDPFDVGVVGDHGKAIQTQYGEANEQGCPLVPVHERMVADQGLDQCRHFQFKARVQFDSAEGGERTVDG